MSKAGTRYTWRPLWTVAGMKRRPIRELLFLMLCGLRRLVPGWMARVVPHRLRRLLYEKDEFSLRRPPLEGMMIESVEEAPGNESALVQTLVESFREAKRRQTGVPESYLPGAGWKKIMESQWSGFREAVNRRDLGAVSAFLRNFFRNEGISGMWGSTGMFASFAAVDGRASLNRAEMLRRQYSAWRTEFPKVPVSELDAPRIGNPWGYILEGTLVYEPVFEYHYQADYFARLLSGISNPVILEIGGGFGGLAYHVLKRIPQARYLGFDLPENILLQSYYLSCAFPGRKILTCSGDLSAPTQDTFAEHDIVLLPNFMLPQVASGSVDLVVNVRSLSEMPAETIGEYLRQIDRVSRLFFFQENIFKERGDGLHGIPTSEFPALDNLILVADSESRWPRYQADSPYPCREKLYLHRSALGTG